MRRGTNIELEYQQSLEFEGCPIKCFSEENLYETQ